MDIWYEVTEHHQATFPAVELANESCTNTKKYRANSRVQFQFRIFIQFIANLVKSWELLAHPEYAMP